MKMSFRYDSPKDIQALLNNSSLSMNKRFGQNFLISQGGRQRIVDAIAKRAPSGYFWEIGPGIGSLTHKVIEFASDLVLFEIDRGFITLLKKLTEQYGNCKIIEGDVLKSWPLFCEQDKRVPDVVFGNLPYNIGAQCIASFIEKGLIPEKMVFTLQKEVVQRMCALSGSKQYSSFTVLCSLDYTIEHVCDLQPGAFYPAPEVVSSVVVLNKKSHPIVPCEDRTEFISFMHALFASRRKTMLNNIKKRYPLPEEKLESLVILLKKHSYDIAVRAEKLAPEQIAEVFYTVRN